MFEASKHEGLNASAISVMKEASWPASSAFYVGNVRGAPMPLVRLLLAVVVAGIAGTIANSIIVAALTPNAFMPLALSPGRNGVAIAVAVLLPLIYATMSGAAAAAVAIVALTVIPSILAKLVFGIGAPWAFVLGVNAVYAVAAWAVYLAIARPRTG